MVKWSVDLLADLLGVIYSLFNLVEISVDWRHWVLGNQNSFPIAQLTFSQNRLRCQRKWVPGLWWRDWRGTGCAPPSTWRSALGSFCLSLSFRLTGPRSTTVDVTVKDIKEWVKCFCQKEPEITGKWWFEAYLHGGSFIVVIEDLSPGEVKGDLSV